MLARGADLGPHLNAELAVAATPKRRPPASRSSSGRLSKATSWIRTHALIAPGSTAKVPERELGKAGKKTKPRVGCGRLCPAASGIS